VIDTSVESFEPIEYSRKDTCATQKQAARHNSVYDTLRTGEDVVYVAPCEVASGEADKRKAGT